jgi:hypothetical protein
MSSGQVALLISFGSLLIAATSLGWNVYRDIIRKPKLVITLMVGAIIFSRERHVGRVVVSVTNCGPGKTTAKMLQLRKTSWWRRLLRQQRFAALIHDYTDDLSARLPAPLEVGDKVDLTFRFAHDLFLLQDFTHIGISDPFGRVYWCKGTDYRDAKRKYLEVPEAEREAPNQAMERTADRRTLPS